MGTAQHFDSGELHDLAPPRVNPFRAHREALGLSQAEVARGAGIQQLHVLRAEQGLHEAAPPSLLRYFVKTPLDRSLLGADYYRWQDEVRRSRHLERWHPIGRPWTVWTLLRLSCLVNPSSRPSWIGVSKLLLVQPSIVRSFRNGWVANPDSTAGRESIVVAAFDCGLTGELEWEVPNAYPHRTG
jgi:transcriptional regulator with XRE-family HTH domain